jgi:Ion channel
VAVSPQGTPIGVWDQYAYRILSVAAFGIVAVGTVVYHFLEDWSWVDSLYFSVVAGTTVGFGDLVPTTDAAKLFTVLYILLAVSVIATYLNVRFRTRGVGARLERFDDRDGDS